MLTIQKLQSVEIAIPPLPEQQRIVGLLDEAFEGIATARANAEKNLLNARALFESHLQTVFTQRGPGWVETTLGRATNGIFTGPFGSPPERLAGFCPERAPARMFLDLALVFRGRA